MRRANWFFYRELYSGYKPLYSNRYELFWDKTARPHIEKDNISVEVIDVGQGRCAVKVYADRSINGIADVYISYRSESLVKSPLVFQNMVKVQQVANNFEENQYESNYLRAEGTEYIPVTVVDGYGEVIIESLPKYYEKVDLAEVDCKRIFTAPFDYVMVTNAAGSDGGVRLNIDPDPRNSVKFKAARGIKIGKQTYPILEKHISDSASFVLVGGSADPQTIAADLAGGNQCEMVRE